MAFPPNKRLTQEVVRAILMSRAHPSVTAHTLTTRYGIACSPSTVRRIRDGNRHPTVSRVGTMWDPDPATAHPDSPLHQAGYRRRKAKRWARRPPYLNPRTGRLKRAYRLVDLRDAA
jgi:hypothetical protein